jgi:hypothetical protein
MNRSIVRAAIGFVLAPLSPFLLLAAIQAVGDVDTNLGVDRGATINMAYFWTMLIAVPAYRLITKHGTFRFHHAVAIGGVVGFMLWATLPLWPVLICVALGLFAGIALWSIVAGPGRLRAHRESRDGRDGATSRLT